MGKAHRCYASRCSAEASRRRRQSQLLRLYLRFCKIITKKRL